MNGLVIVNTFPSRTHATLVFPYESRCECCGLRSWASAYGDTDLSGRFDFLGGFFFKNPLSARFPRVWRTESGVTCWHGGIRALDSPVTVQTVVIGCLADGFSQIKPLYGRKLARRFPPPQPASQKGCFVVLRF